MKYGLNDPESNFGTTSKMKKNDSEMKELIKILKDRNPAAAELVKHSQNTRSCQLIVKNQTQYTITSFSHAFVGKCRADVETFDIEPNRDENYFYERAGMSLSGCAGVQTFGVRLSASSKLSFLVVFRNYTVQILKKSKNKVAILRMNETWDCNTKIDFRSFDEIMKNEMSSPTFKYLDGYYQSEECTFNSVLAAEHSGFRVEFDNITVDISMTPEILSKVEVKLSTKPAIEENTFPTGM